MPFGEVKIGVENVPIPRRRRRFQKTKGVTVGGLVSVSIPPRYKDPATSGLTCTVTSSGEQEKSIELTP